MTSRFYSFALVVFSGALVAGEIFFKNGAPHVQLSKDAGITGHTRFSRDGRPFVSFEGIPFARVRERFAASELLLEPDWRGFRNASVKGDVCTQSFFGQGGVIGIEDCLNLAVHVPIGAKPPSDAGFPVMIQIHGGGFGVGSGVGFRGSFFMDENVVLVSINYRLGVLGFLSTGDDVVPGNNGLKDQVQALRWVKENIGKFGGNANSVTVFGVSAGGASTHYLKLSPTTKDLIHRVISQSGISFAPWAFKPDPRKEAVMLAKHLKCEAQNPTAPTSEEIAACFKGQPVDRLVQASMEYKPSWPAGSGGIYFVPVVEPKGSASSKNIPFITEAPFVLIMRNDAPNKHVPWMTGNTKDEGVLFGMMAAPTEQLMKELDERWTELLPGTLHLDDYLLPKDQAEIAKDVKKFYLSDKPLSSETKQAFYDLYTDWFGHHGVKLATEMTVSKGESVYLYTFSYRGKKSILEIFMKTPNDDKVVTHADDVYYQDEDPEIVPGMGGGSVKLEGEDVEFSRNFVRLWASFATHGKPTHSWGNSAGEVWTPVSKEEAAGKKPMRYYNIDSNPGFIDETFTDRMKFLDGLNEKIAPDFVTEWNKEKTEL